MPMYEEPVVGAFYEDENGRTFEVIAFDENDGTIKIQYSDNSLDEFDLDDWYGMDLEREEPDDEEEDAKDAADDSAPDDDADLDDDEDDDYPDEDAEE